MSIIIWNLLFPSTPYWPFTLLFTPVSFPSRLNVCFGLRQFISLYNRRWRRFLRVLYTNWQFSVFKIQQTFDKPFLLTTKSSILLRSPTPSSDPQGSCCFFSQIPFSKSPCFESTTSSSLWCSPTMLSRNARGFSSSPVVSMFSWSVDCSDGSEWRSVVVSSGGLTPSMAL